ncbi:hypothetical protein Tco_0231305 [Tanacetum coccineum]
MAPLKFADSHNMVAFLEKPAESDGFEPIVDFLNEHTIKYALTINPTIYTSCIEQFWVTTKAKTVNGEEQLQALVDRKKVIITEASIRRDLQLEDAEGINCLPNAIIFEELIRMSAKTITWNEFSSTMASAIICLATNQKFNFSKYIFESMVKNLNNENKFLMYPRFVQVFLDKQVGDMSTHDPIYVTPSHTNKVFRNMKRVGKGFSKDVTPLFPTMMVQAYKEMGEGLENITNSHHTPTITQPSTSQPHKKQKPRKPKRKDTKIPQSSSPTKPIADEAANEENVPTHSNDPLLSGEDRLILQEWIELYADEDIYLVNVPRDEDMFGVNDLEGDEVVVESDVAAKKKDDEVKVVKEVVNTADDAAPVNATTITTVELTLAQKLAELMSARPKAKGLVILEQQPSESITTTTTKTTAGILFKSQVKQEQQLHQQFLQRTKEARIAREKEKANAALIAYWNDIHDKVETDYELAQRLQQEEQEELTIEEKSKLFEPKDLKNKSFATIQDLFNKAMKRVNTFVDMDTELLEGGKVRVEGNKIREESSSKRAGDELELDKSKKQKLDEKVEVEVDDAKEAEELKQCLEIVPDDRDDVTVDATPLSIKILIVDYKIYQEGKKSFFQIIRADDLRRQSQ